MRRLGVIIGLAAAVLSASDPCSAKSARTERQASVQQTYASRLASVTSCDDLAQSLPTIPDAARLLRAVFSTSKTMKDEFETQGEYVARLHSMVRSKLGGSDLVLVTTPQTGFKYDPENRVMKAELSFAGPPTDSPFDSLAHLDLGRKYDVIGSYVGSNSFGVSKRVTKGYINNLILSFDPKYLGSDPFGQEVAFQMEPAEARALRNSTRLVFLGKIVGPYIHESITRMEPTLDGPVDGAIFYQEVLVEPLCVLLTSNGRVIHRVIDRPFSQ